ncbi:MAG: PQQ-dependent dehydrogenase, methanol/ethanol family [Arenicella sp.]|nr:PQQ-dependent dehydrogenase, methanol/ethanol family [Arenicella sp.]
MDSVDDSINVIGLALIRGHNTANNMKFVSTISILSLTILSACTDQQKAEDSTVLQTESAKLVAQSATPIITSVNRETIIEASSSGWRSHGRTYSEQRHSPLNAINAESVVDLGLAWSFDLGSSRGIETTPIVHNGVMYVTATWNKVHALDAKTGQHLWSFDPEIDKEQAAKGCCDVINRGVAIWGDSVFTATMDGRLISLDAKTGDTNWDINTIDKTKPYTISGAPRIIDGKVIIGNGGAELGVRGYITAYAAETGKQLWRFYTVPGNPEDGFENATMEMAAKTWTGEYWQAGAGGTAWDSMAYDPELDLLYIGVGNGTPWNHSIRSPDGGDNLFLSSIVAVRPSTGEYVWHYQTTPADNWDYTATQHMILAELELDGKLTKVIMQAPKNGFFYVLDRETGEFISANNFVPVTWATHIDPISGRPVETDAARYSGKAPSIQLPGPLGAHNWQPMSYSPDTGLVYIPAQEAPWAYIDKPDYKFTDGAWNTGVDFGYSGLPTDKAVFKAAKASLKGRLIAWNPITQKEIWRHEYKGPWNGGVLSTSGNLVFQGAADAHFAAFNAETGEPLWTFFTQTGVMAAPITYELESEQYLAVASGWGGSYVLGYGGVLPTGGTPKIGRVMVFKLGANGELPQLDKSDVALPAIPKPLAVSEELVQQGAYAYGNNCGFCHGDQAFSSGLVPNLRYSAITTNPQAWSNVVSSGALAKQGMPNFGKVLDDETVEAIRAYVISEANSNRGKAFYDSVSAD